MDILDKVITYNQELKETLSLMYNKLNHGQQQKLLKDEKLKTLLEIYKVIER